MSSSKKLLQSASGFLNLSGSLNVEDVFSTHLYEGTNADNNAQVNGIDLLGEGGMIWIKDRDANNSSRIVDTARGDRKLLSSDLTSAEFTDQGSTYGLNFNNNGFTVRQEYNGNMNYTHNYVSWSFRKAPNFFDVVTYSGSNSTQSIAHNLGSVPGMIWVKQRNSSGRWTCWHRSTDTPRYGRVALNTHDAYYKYPGIASFQYLWGETDPTDTHFTVGPHNDTSYSGSDYVAYLFAHDTSDEGLIQCGSYTGNGSTSSGPHIDLGFEPQWLLVKSTAQSTNWTISDMVRGFHHGNEINLIYAHKNDAEASISTTPSQAAPTSTGFQIQSSGTNFNTSGTDYIYMAIRRGPMATPTSRADVFNLDTTAYTGADTSYPAWGVANFADFIMARNFNATDDWQVNARVLGPKHMKIDANEEATNNNMTWDWMTGCWENAQFNNESAYIWTRSPGFCDVVTYTGNGNNNRTINHNLGVVPEMIWHKTRHDNNTGYLRGWTVGSTHLGTSTNDKYLMLNEEAAQVDAAMFNDTPPTSSVFTVSSDAKVNANNVPYFAVLFASISGISKIGTFSHTSGSTTDVDCGFSSGVYWVMIKRIDSHIGGQWYVYDTGMGINDGNEQTINLQSDTYFSANADHIDQINSGFQVQSVFFPTGTYFFYAMAN